MAHRLAEAGILPMFGAVESSTDEHGGSGINYSLEITDIVAALTSRGTWDPAKVRVSFVPHRADGDRMANVVTKPVEVGRVSVYYE